MIEKIEVFAQVWQQIMRMEWKQSMASVKKKLAEKNPTFYSLLSLIDMKNPKSEKNLEC